ncbi:polymorphic toxin type 8 domain-containing protein [Sorangium sp. So ce327]|uniref:polymorphic toxin type 8 domain-containing protein n=1 Tax=Sorangium sp. So ce327 TaxID=3133301 RepID=UPI003F619206
MWLSPDPILDEYMEGGPGGGVFNPGNLGLYSYTLNNPVNLVDPDGRQAQGGHRNFPPGANGCRHPSCFNGPAGQKYHQEQMLQRMNAGAAAAGRTSRGIGDGMRRLLFRFVMQQQAARPAAQPAATPAQPPQAAQPAKAAQPAPAAKPASSPQAAPPAQTGQAAAKQPASSTGTVKGGTGRARAQERLRQIAEDPSTSSADRGWIKQEQNAIDRGQRPTIRVPPGKQLAHSRGREAAKGYDHVESPSKLQDTDLHRTQHKLDDFGRANKERR